MGLILVLAATTTTNDVGDFLVQRRLAAVDA